MPRCCLPGFALALCAFFSPLANAQYMSMFNAANQSAVNFAGTVSVNSAIAKSAKFNSARASKGSSKGAVRQDASHIGYPVDPARRAAVVRRYVERARALNARDGDELQTLFRTRDLFAEFAQNARAYKLDTSDLGDVMTAYWAVAWGAAHKVGRPSVKQVQAISGYIRRAPTFGKLKALRGPERQRLADDMMIKLILVDGAAQFAIRNRQTASLKELAAAVRRRFQQSYGVDLLRVRLPG
ncbi:MAG: hypothetical protein K0U93_10450 [Gammaproteobacteria bacterium]|nr:hypothetical protein [Gammaproteobacteria bacterium]